MSTYATALLTVLLSEFGYPDDAGTSIPDFAANVLHEQRLALAAAQAENERLKCALRGIIEIGKRDMRNPKYDGYFEEARAALGNAGKKDGGE